MKLYKRTKKIGQPPGTFTYTGNKNLDIPAKVMGIVYNENAMRKLTDADIEQLSPTSTTDIIWLNIIGLHDTALIEKIAKLYQLHSLTVEDILNVEQRPKVEEFDNYQFITLKQLNWNAKKNKFTPEQFSIVTGKNFVLSFQESEHAIFDDIYQRLASGPNQRLRQQGTDYLTYRLLDTVIDYYFIVLEGLGDHVEMVEKRIISNPKSSTTHEVYRLKHQLLVLRKSIWPLREVISHLLQAEGNFVSAFTRIYLRDLYDHIVQAIDTVEIFRDMLSSMLDMYLSSLTNRMNEIMKTLTIIATIFIPITFIASVFGMNFRYMPELQWHYGYYIVIGMMALVAIGMLFYFRRKKWI